MAQDGIKGEFYRLYLDTTTAETADDLIGCAQEITINTTIDEVEEPLCSEDYTPGTQGTWKKSAPGNKSFTIDVSGLVIPTNSVNIQEFHDSIDAGTIHTFKIELLDDITPAPDPTVLKEYTGQAWISSKSDTASNEEFATYSITMTGYGALALATP